MELTNIKFLSSSIDTACKKCRRLYPADMLHYNASRIVEHGMSSMWDVCEECARDHDNFWKSYIKEVPPDNLEVEVEMSDGTKANMFHWNKMEGFDPYAEPSHIGVVKWRFKDKQDGCKRKE